MTYPWFIGLLLLLALLLVSGCRQPAPASLVVPNVAALPGYYELHECWEAKRFPLNRWEPGCGVVWVPA